MVKKAAIVKAESADFIDEHHYCYPEADFAAWGEDGIGYRNLPCFRVKMRRSDHEAIQNDDSSLQIKPRPNMGPVRRSYYSTLDKSNRAFGQYRQKIFQELVAMGMPAWQVRRELQV